MNAKNVSSFVGETLDSLMGSSFSKNVKITVEQLNENMADLARRNKIKKVPFFGKTLPTSGSDMTEAGKLLNKAGAGANGGSSYSSSSFDQMLERFAPDVVAAYKANPTETLGDATGTNIREKIGMLNYLANVPSAYLNVADKQVKDHRIGALVGGYATAAVGMRIVKGGSITHNQYGQKDIAGIPFV